MRSKQEFGRNQIFPSAAYALEYGDFFRAASSLLRSSHQFVKIGGNVVARNSSFLQRS